MTAFDVIASLWQHLELPAEALDQLELSGRDPIVPSSFAIGTAAQASIGAVALAAAQLWHLRTGRRQKIGVDMHHAAVEFRSESYLCIDGAAPPEPWDALARLYRTGDRSWVRLHTNFAHHRDGVLRLLGCENDRDAVADALLRWKARAFEDAAAAAGLCVTALRSFDDGTRRRKGGQ